MIPIAPDHPLQLPDVFGRDVEVAGFVHYQHAQSVAGIEKLGGRWMVGAAHGIHPHLLKEAETEIPHRIGHGHPNARMVLVITNSLDFKGLVVEIETGIGIEAKGSESAEVRVFVYDFPGLPENRADLVKIRKIDGPKFRILWEHCEIGDDVVEGWNLTIDRNLFEDSAFCIQKGGFDLNFFRLLA